ncbi:AAA family ATPase [Candidatus Marithrix sp. Canyon 246]|uniref:AAA family ATPase n=1 Tax=Candidatus Marithrix sp. Canyon 246 TaxID=1827136 RepID=UPI000A40E7A2|nr:AAA family ATPase [Candidatus Marithrix sp. Canyon 246]
MKIEYIKIRNFKLFADEEFSFNPQMNVIIGNNATGKTTILEALSYSLGTVLMGLKREESIPLRYEEKRREIISPDNIEIQLPFRIDIQQTLDNINYKWHRSTDKDLGGATNYKSAKEMINKAKELANQVRNGDNVKLPLIAYYGTERVNDRHQNKVTYQKQGSRLDGYYGALDSRTLKGQFLEWFKSYEDSVLKFGKDKTLYHAFTNSITSMVKDWKKIHFSWEMDDMLGQLENGSWVSFSMMSAGYQSVVRLTADIAYRAIKLNPHLGGNAIKETEGVVLIDEIDMHLHPKWQKNIISDLKNTFPKIQFIATTHSPFIIQSLRAEELIKLDGDDVVDNPFTKSIPDIAEEEMNLESVQRSRKFLKMQKVASDYFALIQEGKTSKNDYTTNKIKEELDKLELEFNSDPVFVALMKAERKTELG